MRLETEWYILQKYWETKGKLEDEEYEGLGDEDVNEFILFEEGNVPVSLQELQRRYVEYVVREYDDMTYKEIAEHLGVSTNSLYYMRQKWDLD